MQYTTYETTHYVFHCQPGSYAEEKLPEIASGQEAAYQRITSVLGVTLPFKIRYWLCQTPEEVGQLYGDNEPCNGFAREPDTVYAVYNREVQCVGPHEDAHLISYRIAVPDSAFLREGLAMFFDETWWGEPNDVWTKKYITGGRCAPLGDLLRDAFFYSQDCALTYPIAGAFTKFLIECFGMERYLTFYRNPGTDCFDCGLDGLESQFREWVTK